MKDGLTIPRDRIEDMAAAVRRAIFDGSRSASVRSYARRMARSVMRGGAGAPDPVDVLRAAHEDVLARWVHLPDPHGEELIQQTSVTLAAASGDCDDAAALMGAIARALGFRVALALVSVKEPDGETLTARHIYAAAEIPGNGWAPLDVDEQRPFGEAPVTLPDEVTELAPIEDQAPQGVGFLGIIAAIAGVASAVAGVVGASKSASATKKAAKAAVSQAELQLEGEKVQAAALRYVADKQASVATESLATTERMFRSVLDFAREQLPVAEVIALAYAGVQVVEAVVGEPSHARRKAA